MASSYLPEGSQVVGTPLERSNVFRRQGNDLYCKAREVARNADPYTNLRGVQESVKLFQAAMAEYGKALHFLPNDHRLFGNRALCYQAVEDWVKCREDAQRCVKLKSDYTKGWLLLAASQSHLGAGASPRGNAGAAKWFTGDTWLAGIDGPAGWSYFRPASSRGWAKCVSSMHTWQHATRLALNYPAKIFHATARAARAHVRHVAGHFAGHRFGKISRVLQNILEISRRRSAMSSGPSPGASASARFGRKSDMRHRDRKLRCADTIFCTRPTFIFDCGISCGRGIDPLCVHPTSYRRRCSDSGICCRGSWSGWCTPSKFPGSGVCAAR